MSTEVLDQPVASAWMKMKLGRVAAAAAAPGAVDAPVEVAGFAFAGASFATSGFAFVVVPPAGGTGIDAGHDAGMGASGASVDNDATSAMRASMFSVPR
jgi:hypothetical protein